MLIKIRQLTPHLTGMARLTTSVARNYSPSTSRIVKTRKMAKTLANITLYFLKKKVDNHLLVQKLNTERKLPLK